MSRSWFQFQNAAAEDVASVSIFDEIGKWGVTAKDFITELSTVKAKVVNLDINSLGGSVFDGVAIYNALTNRVKAGTTVNVTVMGVAASIASVVAMAGSKIIMPANTFMMIHNPWGSVSGGSSDMREYADLLDKVTNNLVATYVARTGKLDEEIRALLATDTWLTADEAKDMGFCDEVTAAYAISAKFDTEHLPANVMAIFNAAKTPTPKALAELAALAQAELEVEQIRLAAEAEAATASAASAAAAAAVPFSDQVAALCETSGMSAYAGTWAITKDATISTVQASIADAREITALCALLKLPNAAEALIRARKTVAESRVELANMLALSDERRVTDTTVRNSNTPIENAGPSAVTTAGIWAKRRL